MPGRSGEDCAAGLRSLRNRIKCWPGCISRLLRARLWTAANCPNVSGPFKRRAGIRNTLFSRGPPPRASGAPGLTDWTYASTVSAAPSALCSKVIAPKEALPPVAGGVQAAFGICAANRSGGGPISSSRTTPASIEPIKHRIIPRPPFAAILFHFDPNWLDHRNTVDLQRCLEQIHRTAGYRRDG